MKEVKAFIKPHRLDEVILALRRIEGLTGLSISDVKGFGRGRRDHSSVALLEELDDPPPHVRIELVCRDELADAVIAAITGAAHTGLRGDGKIYVLPVETAVRIGTGERGEDAV